MYLIINTSFPDRGALYLVSREEVLIASRVLYQGDAERIHVLREIDSLLRDNDLTPQDIAGVAVVQGPGHFSFLRTGIVIANTWGMVLQIPVGGVVLGEDMMEEVLIAEGMAAIRGAKVGEAVMPEYGKEPNITVKK